MGRKEAAQDHMARITIVSRCLPSSTTANVCATRRRCTSTPRIMCITTMCPKRRLTIRSGPRKSICVQWRASVKSTIVRSRTSGPKWSNSVALWKRWRTNITRKPTRTRRMHDKKQCSTYSRARMSSRSKPQPFAPRLSVKLSVISTRTNDGCTRMRPLRMTTKCKHTQRAHKRNYDKNTNASLRRLAAKRTSET